MYACSFNYTDSHNIIKFTLLFTAEAGWYEPDGRDFHSTVVVGKKLFLWAGNQKETPNVHDSATKRAFLSHVDVFCLEIGSWEKQNTSGIPPLGVNGYACVAVDSNIHYFGGWCGHLDCVHNSVHKLNTSTLAWSMMARSASKAKAPMKKSHCGMVSFKDSEENFLFVVGGVGTGSSLPQPGAQYKIKAPLTFTNEQHLFSLKEG